MKVCRPVERLSTLLLAGVLTLASSSGNAAGAPVLKLKQVPFTDVAVRDSFWTPRQETNRIASIPVNIENIHTSGTVSNFVLAAEGETNGFAGPVFMDSDAYKAIEAASFSLANHPDPDLDRQLDTIIAKIAAAQQPDGYLNTYYTVKALGRRWTDLRNNHELYCAGHLFEAAAAHYQATGKKTLLNVAARYADYIDSVFGPPPRRMGYGGHPEIELALVKLWKVTDEKRYYDLAQFFVENRGKHFFAEEHHTPEQEYDGAYWQDDVPIFDHGNIKGHAVRATYLLSGVADVAAVDDDPRLLGMLDRVWCNTAECNTYLTGGIGPSAHNEGFTEDYDLPNLSAYQETCASVSLAMWNLRMALLYGDAKYADAFERALYNGMLAGVSQDGTRFFYVNPLESNGDHHRKPWFGCACCPPNAARTIASVGGYAYATGENSLWVNLYIQGSVKAKVSGQHVELDVATSYPWDGKVLLKPELKKPLKFDLHLRVPGWCSGAMVSVNGKKLSSPVMLNGYLVLSREWKKGDVVELNLPMPVQRIVANPSVKADIGLVALQRGPLAYCLEGVAQSEPLSLCYLPAEAGLKAVMDSKLFGGTIVIRARGESSGDLDWSNKLYQALPPAKPVTLTAIPYYAWDNRAACPMKVWLPTGPRTRTITRLEQQATVRTSFCGNNSQERALNDGVVPKKSFDASAGSFNWWPHKGSTNEWVQYQWGEPVTISGAGVLWYDDAGAGECKVPAWWELQWFDEKRWHPVETDSDYPIVTDQMCSVNFKPVTTRVFRIKIRMQPGWSAGILEWKVDEADRDLK